MSDPELTHAGHTLPTTGTDPWRVARRDHGKAAQAQEESLFALANGSLGVRGGLEEDLSPTQGSFLSGAWERTPIEYHERFPGFARSTDTRVPVADGTRIGLRLGSAAVQLDQGEWLDFSRTLDLRHGCLQRTLRWRSAEGATLEVSAERLVALDTPGLLAIRYGVRSIDYCGPITLESAIDTVHDAVSQGEDPRIGTRIDGGLRTVAAAADDRQAWVRQQTSQSDIQVLCGQHHLLREGGLSFHAADSNRRGVTQTFASRLQPGQQVLLEKYVAYAWTSPAADAPDGELERQVEQLLQQASTAGYSALAERQSMALNRFWATADLAIPGDAETEQALRLNLFHVYQSSPRDSSGNIAAKGLTGEGYEGHYFWDAEAFMLPAMVGVAPELARHMLEYRYRTLDRARLHAREMNHARGALFPWRTISGDECSAYFPSGSAQYHINAAIAWAIRLYVDASGDDTFLQAQGAEILFETARIWLDVGHFNARRGGAFCIHEVTGPDEYSALVDNNHYTNRMAQRHLRDAAAVARQMAEQNPAAFAELGARIGLHADEYALWQRAADAMYLPVDAQLGIFPQDDGFLDKPRLPPQDTEHARQPLLLRLHPLTIYRHQVCKQADTLLALVLAGDDVDLGAKRRNLEYYESVTVHDSTLSASTFAILAAEVGQLAKAGKYFHETLRVDLDDLHGNASHGLHMAAMAGSWLALTWGFGGMRVIDGMPALAPSLPPEWPGYRFGLRWRDSQLRVEVDADGVLYSLTAGALLRFLHNGLPQQLQAGQSLRLPRTVSAAAWPSLPHAFRAVIFDLDGVIADTAVVHHAAWKQLAAEIGLPFDDAIGERLKGVDRLASLEIVLEGADRRYSDSEKLALAERKNAFYREQIEHFGPADMLPGARAAIESARRAGLRIGLASASRNASLLLQRMQIAELFDHVVDAGTITQAKPHPEIFLAAARGLGMQPSECLGVEDAAAGVTSIHAAGMAAIGIGRPDVLSEADAVLARIADFDIHRFLTATTEMATQNADGHVSPAIHSTTDTGEKSS